MLILCMHDKYSQRQTQRKKVCERERERKKAHVLTSSLRRSMERTVGKRISCKKASQMSPTTAMMQNSLST